MLFLKGYVFLFICIIIIFGLLTYIRKIISKLDVVPFDEFPLPNIQVSAKSSIYTALIVEPRKHKALEFVLNNFLDNLDNHWNIVVLHGTYNKDFVNKIIEKMDDSNKIRITTVNINVENLTVAQYSELFYNPLFYNYIPTETFLIFQTDSIILKQNKDKINNFLKYDYVGAPWPKTMGILGKMEVGNGGLSLRKKSKMLELLKYKSRGVDRDINPVYGKYIAEDQFFCGYHIKEVNISKPTFNDAKNFSVECIFYTYPFGIHKPWLWLPPNQFNILTNKYPDILRLRELNK